MASDRSKARVIEEYNLGVSFYNKGDFSNAITQFKEAIAADKTNERYKSALASAYNNRGVLVYSQKKYESAASDFKKAFELDTHNKQYADNLKLARETALKDKIDKLCKGAYDAFNKKEYTESINRLKEAMKFSPQDNEIKHALAVAYNGRGVFAYSQGKFGGALEDFEMAHQIMPTQEQYKININTTRELARRNAPKKKKKR